MFGLQAREVGSARSLACFCCPVGRDQAKHCSSLELGSARLLELSYLALASFVPGCGYYPTTGCVVDRGTRARTKNHPVLPSIPKQVDIVVPPSAGKKSVLRERWEFQAVSGAWMNKFVRRRSRRRGETGSVPTGDVVKNSIRRSWTSEGLQKGSEPQPAAAREERERPSSQFGPSLTHIPANARLPPRPHPQQQQPPNSHPLSQRRAVNERPHRFRPAHSVADAGVTRMDPSDGDGGLNAPPPALSTRKSPSPTARSDSRLSSTPSPQDVGSSSPTLRRPAAPSPLPRTMSSASSRPVSGPPSRPESSESVSPSPTPSPRQRSPIQKQRNAGVDMERYVSNESQDSGYLTSQVTVHRESHKLTEFVDSGYDNHGSPRTSRSSEHSRQSSGVSSSRTDSREPTGESFSGSDASDGEEDLDPTSEVVFRKISPKKKKKGGGSPRQKHLNDVHHTQPTATVSPSWGQIGGAHSLPRAKARTVHSISMPFYQYSSGGADDGSWEHPTPLTQSLNLMGGSLTLPRRRRVTEVWVTGSESVTGHHEDRSEGTSGREGGPFMLRPLDGHRRTPTGSPVVKRIRRNQRKSSAKGGGRLRSPERFPGKEMLPFDIKSFRDRPEQKGASGGEQACAKGREVPNRTEGGIILSSSFEDVHVASLEFDDDPPIVARSLNSDCYSDILLNVTDKIIPEGDDYKLVFISSSSSKSSGLNSLDGSFEEASDSSSRRVSSVVDESEVMVFVEESDWEPCDTQGSLDRLKGNSSISKEGGVEFSPLDGPSPVTMAADEVTVVSSIHVCSENSPVATYQEIVESFSPTHSVDEVETVDHILGPVIQGEVVSVEVGDTTTPSTAYIGSSGSFFLSSIDTADLNASACNSSQMLGASYIEPAGVSYAANARAYTQMHANRYFNRSDSARSSGERSIEEVSCFDHVFPFHTSPSADLEDDYKSILSEIQNYTSQSCDRISPLFTKYDSTTPEPPPLYLRLSQWNDTSLSPSSNDWPTLSGTHTSIQPTDKQLVFVRNPHPWETLSPSSNLLGFPSDLSVVQPLEVTSALSTGDASELDTVSTVGTEASSVRERLDSETAGDSPLPDFVASVETSAEWEYRMMPTETTTMALQVNLSAETESNVDADVEVQSVHCTVDDDTFSVSTFSEDGLSMGATVDSPDVEKVLDLVAVMSTPSLNMSEALDEISCKGVVDDKISSLSDNPVPTVESDSQPNNSDSATSNDVAFCNDVSDVSFSANVLCDERRVSQGSLSATECEAAMSLSSEGIEDEDEDLVDAATLETKKDTASKSKEVDEAIRLQPSDGSATTGPDTCLNRKTAEFTTDLKNNSEATSLELHQCSVDERQSSLPTASTDSGNLVYYLAPQGMQSMYLVRSEKLGSSNNVDMPTTVRISSEQPSPDQQQPEAEGAAQNGDDRMESDTDSQDTVIEGEAYKRIREIGIQNKIIEANEELNSQNMVDTTDEHGSTTDQKEEAVDQKEETVDQKEEAVYQNEEEDKHLNEHLMEPQEESGTQEEVKSCEGMGAANEVEVDHQTTTLLTKDTLESSQPNDASPLLKQANEGDLHHRVASPLLQPIETVNEVVVTNVEEQNDVSEKVQSEKVVMEEIVESEKEALEEVSSEDQNKEESKPSEMETKANETNATDMASEAHSTNLEEDVILIAISKETNEQSTEKEITALLEKEEIGSKTNKLNVESEITPIEAKEGGLETTEAVEIIKPTDADAEVNESDAPPLPVSAPTESVKTSEEEATDKILPLNNVENSTLDDNVPICTSESLSAKATSDGELDGVEKSEKENDKTTLPNTLTTMTEEDAGTSVCEAKVLDLPTEFKADTTVDEDAEINISAVGENSVCEVETTPVTGSALAELSTTLTDSANEESLSDTVKSSVDVSSLHQLIEKSRKFNDTEPPSDGVEPPSVLEKYFTCSLGQENENNKKKQPNRISREGKVQELLANYFEEFGEKTEGEEEEVSFEADDVSGNASGQVSSDNWDSEASERFDDAYDSDTTFSDSASSEECNFDREQELRAFNRSIDFSLHTIIEESCEESESERERQKKNATPQPPDESDLEKYFNFTIGDTLLQLHKRRSIAEDSEISDTYSETSSSVYSDGTSKMDEDIDPAILASSRLEKYFMTGFLGLEHCTPLEDHYGTDESGSIGSENDAHNNSFGSAASQSPTARRKGDHPPGMTRINSVGSEMSSTSADGNVSDAGSSSTLSDSDEQHHVSEEDGNVAPFEKNDGFDTIKRKKKEKQPAKPVETTTNKTSGTPICKSETGAVDATIPAEYVFDVRCAENSSSTVEDSVMPQSTNSKKDGLPLVAEDITKDSIEPSTKTKVQIEEDLLTATQIKSTAADKGKDNMKEEDDVLLSLDKSCPSNIADTLLALSNEAEVSATPLPDGIVVPGTSIDIALLDKAKQCGLDRKQQSRDSGFIGSSDDLLKDSVDALDDSSTSIEGSIVDVTNVMEPAALGDAISCGLKKEELLADASSPTSKKTVVREPSGSDDETRYIVGQLMDQITKGLSSRMNGSPLLPRAKPPELEMFEAELTKLMKIVPGIDATVKEIVEELSSTDYYSDSYESSDYTNSDFDGPTRLGFLRRSIRSSLRSNDDSRLHMRSSLRSNDSLRLHWSKDGATGLLVSQENCAGPAAELPAVEVELEDGLREDASSPFTRETIYIYERLMSSLGRMAEQASKENSDSEQRPGNQSPSSTRSQASATLQAVQHIRDRLTSLMREVHPAAEGIVSSTHICRNNSSSSSSSWMGPTVRQPRPHAGKTSTLQQPEALDASGKPYTGSLHADITRWLAKQQFNSGDEQSISSTSSTTYESEDSPTDTELSIDSDDVSTPATMFPHKDSKKVVSAITKLEKSGSNITVVDDNLSFQSLNTPEMLFATHKIGAEANQFCLPSKGKRISDSSLHQLKSLPERGIMDLQYFVTQGTNNEYEVWQSLVIDKDKFTTDDSLPSSVAGTRVPVGGEGDVRPVVRARHLLDSLRSSSSDTLQCISEEDLDSKPSSSRTSVLGSSTNIWSSQSSLADGKRGSLEALGMMPEGAHSPLPDNPVILRKTPGLVAVDIPLSETEAEGSMPTPDKNAYRSSFHTEVLGSGEILNVKDKADFRSSLHLWVENKLQKSSQRAMSAEALPKDYAWSTPNLLSAIQKSKSRDTHVGKAPRPRSMGINMSDNQLDRPDVPSARTKYSTIAKSGPISMSPQPPPTSRDSHPARPKASTLPRIGGDSLHANVSFLHKSPSSFMTNPPPLTAVPSQSKWSRSFQHHAAAADPYARREVQSWPAEDNNTSASVESLTQLRGANSKRVPLKTGVSLPEGRALPIPQISVVDITESNPSGRSSQYGNTSDRESMPEEDIDRLVALHKTRSSLSSLGTRSDSMTSVYSAAGGGRYGTVEVRGEVYFGLSYNYKSGALEVKVKQCRDLASVDTKRSRSDPYVKVYLLPDKSKGGKRKTKVKKHTLNPVFDETLRFNVTISELETRTLWLTVWHSDMFGRNDFLGEVMLPLGYEVFDDPSLKWYPLQERLGPPEEVIAYRGEIALALKYVPPDVTTQKKGKLQKGCLHVLVKDAQNLTAVRANGTSDPFCKSYLLPNKGKVSKQKTHVVKKNCSPKWNHTFVYEDVTLDDLQDRCLELTVWDYDRLTSNDFLGGTRLSLGTGRYQGKEVDWLDSGGDEIAIWQTMLDRPNVWVDGVLMLQPTMEKRLI